MVVNDLDRGPTAFDPSYVVCVQRIGENRIVVYFNMEGTVKQIPMAVLDADIADTINDITDAFVGGSAFTFNDIDGFPVMVVVETIVGTRKYEECCLGLYLNLSSGSTKVITARVASENMDGIIADIEDEINGGPVI